MPSGPRETPLFWGLFSGRFRDSQVRHFFAISGRFWTPLFSGFPDLADSGRFWIPGFADSEILADSGIPGFGILPIFGILAVFGILALGFCWRPAAS